MAGSRVLRARYPGACAGCGTAIALGDPAWWDAGARLLWCPPCHGRAVSELPRPATPATPAAAAASATAPLPPTPPAPPAFDAGEPGRSAQLEFERRHAARERRIDRRWGRLAGLVKLVAGDPQSTTAWSRGAEGERRVAGRLEQLVGDRAVLLHDRRIPGSSANIDLLVVAPSGIWVVDAKFWSGRVERRNVGGWSVTDPRLYVGGRDRSRQVEGLGRQMIAVCQAVPGSAVPVVPALCVIGASWGWFAKPFRCRGVWVARPEPLAGLMLAPGPLTGDHRAAVAATLAHALPPRSLPQ
ncbi:MAG: nuclease-related domain-containing protein [Acidimicrobiales bacterium]